MEEEIYERNYKVKAKKEEHLNMLDKLFAYIQQVGENELSRICEIYIDGEHGVKFQFSISNMHPEHEVYYKLDYEKVEEEYCGYGFHTIRNDEKKYFDLG